MALTSWPCHRPGVWISLPTPDESTSMTSLSISSLTSTTSSVSYGLETATRTSGLMQSAPIRRMWKRRTHRWLLWDQFLLWPARFMRGWERNRMTAGFSSTSSIPSWLSSTPASATNDLYRGRISKHQFRSMTRPQSFGLNNFPYAPTTTL